VFWNRYRYETLLTIPAYSAFHGWDGLSQFGQPITLNFLNQSSNRREAIYPFQTGLDPLGRLQDIMTALLYVRGDVQGSEHTVASVFDADDAVNWSAFEGTDQSIGKRGGEHLALVTGYGLNYQNQVQSGFDLIYQMGQPNQLQANINNNWVTYSQNINYNDYDDLEQAAISQWEAQAQNLRNAGVLQPSNLTNPDLGVYHTDTEEIYINSSLRMMGINTPFTQGLAFDDLNQEINIAQLTIHNADESGMVAVSAMDKNANAQIAPKPLGQSQRMLLVLATDAQNTNMSFEDREGTTLANLGSQPALVKPMNIELSLQNQYSQNLKVYSLDLRGNRRDEIPVQRLGCTAQACNSIRFTLNIANLSHGATTFFEIAADAPPAVNLTINSGDSGQVATLTANAYGSSAISYIDLYRNEQFIARLNQAPYQYTWESGSQLSSTSSTFTAKAYAINGTLGDSNLVVLDSINLFTSGQRVSINALTYNAENTAGGITSKVFNANASNVRLDVTDLQNNLVYSGLMQDNASEDDYRFYWDGNAAAGTYRLTARALNAAGNVTASSKTITITVD